MNLEAHVRDNVAAARGAKHLDGEGLDLQNGDVHSLRARRGSSASRIASPRMLMLSTVTLSKAPA